MILVPNYFKRRHRLMRAYIRSRERLVAAEKKLAAERLKMKALIRKARAAP